MRFLGRSATWLVFTAVLMLGAATVAQAQVCGDATGDGEVTDTDGVQILRAAAQLSSDCTLGPCDINGDGEITDTDGVLALRKAAQLPIEENCDLGGGGQAAVEMATDDVVPFFGLVVPQFPGIEAAAAGIGVEVDDCPEGGTRTKNDQGTLIIVTFDECKIDNPILGLFQIDGSVALGVIAAEVVITDLEITDLDSGRVVVFDGVIDAAPGANDTVIFDGGPVTITTPQGDFEMNFDELILDDEGQAIGGGMTIEDLDDNFEVEMLEFTITSTNVATVVATFDDQTEETYTLNLDTGALTPVS
jgi:hypothetical protein